MVGDDLSRDADVASQLFQPIFDVNSRTVGSNPEVENNDLMMLKGTWMSRKLIKRSAKNQHTFILAESNGLVDNPYPIIAAWHRPAQQEETATKQPGADRLVVGQTQGKHIAKNVDEAEQYFAYPAKTDVGVKIPTQTEANDQQRVAVPFWC